MPTATVQPIPTASPTAAPTATPAVLSPSPSSTAAAVEPLGPGGTTVFPGTYSSAFLPALIFTVDHAAAGLDCVAGYQCRGDVDVNSAAFLDLEFGNVHGAELMLARLDKVFDPAAPSSLIDPPTDFATWFTALPGVTVLQPPLAVTIGALPATQIDARSNNAQLGPQYGMSTHDTRVIGVMVAGQLVVITEQVGPDNTVRDFGAATTSLQPIVDSILWR